MPAILIEGRDLLIVQRPPEDVGRRVNMRIHETGDRANRRRWWWEDSNLREYLARVDNCRQPGTADDRNPSFEQRASSCMTLLHMAVMGAANVDPPGAQAAFRSYP